MYVPARNVGIVKRRDCVVGFFRVGHCDESEGTEAGYFGDCTVLAKRDLEVELVQGLVGDCFGVDFHNVEAMVFWGWLRFFCLKWFCQNLFGHL